MKHSLLIITILFCQSIFADLYKSIGPDGETVYADVPSKNANRIKPSDLPGLSSYTPRQIDFSKLNRTINTTTQRKQFLKYSKINLLSPLNEQTILNGEEGNVSVSLEILPALGAQDKIVTYLDGIKSSQHKTTQFLLKNLYRGEHTLRIAIVDKRQVELISSAMVTIYVKRMSLLHKAKKEARKKKRIAIIRRSTEE